LVGPEGGYSPEEIEMLSKHSNSKSISLGNLTLRSETAAIVMLSRWNIINKVW
ncbi:MAG: 16S rRNA (uracil(1498)-N(3))-methyltransferase, partial [Rhodospirillaceae bacterium]|nr:16S rRNA (uracil(1498)-N(3))-methyltransferase [Rhodospirillaceae bacterium]